MAGELPKYYWLKFGDHYIVTQAITAVHSSGLSNEMKSEFASRTATDEIDGCALPEPGDGTMIKAAFSTPGDNGDIDWA